ncbi:hypothetical protein HanHA300_Chr14g0512041 [Helianthus annuus]|nr:hypothetical protein HanHA300_Chr14g0512041 [Helianthus annuus]KAJ0484526.1 hypothetical protein HanHA89_Chr14g0545101 [Helianthus annuus]KAJ0655080.1 hypothetical protein HanLR1_Chr14g0514381 [Helianthus annuus]
MLPTGPTGNTWKYRGVTPELIQETTDKILQVRDNLLKSRSRQKSYADKRRKPLEFEIGDFVLLKVSPWKGVVRLVRKGNSHLATLVISRFSKGLARLCIDCTYLKNSITFILSSTFQI